MAVATLPFPSKMPSKKNAVGKFGIFKLSISHRRYENAAVWPSLICLLVILSLIWFIIYMTMVDYQLFWLNSRIAKAEMSIQGNESKLKMALRLPVNVNIPEKDSSDDQRIVMPDPPPPPPYPKRIGRSLSSKEQEMIEEVFIRTPPDELLVNITTMSDVSFNQTLPISIISAVPEFEEENWNKLMLVALGIFLCAAILFGIGIARWQWKKQRAERHSYSLHNDNTITEQHVVRRMKENPSFSALQREEQQQQTSIH